MAFYFKYWCKLLVKMGFIQAGDAFRLDYDFVSSPASK